MKITGLQARLTAIKYRRVMQEKGYLFFDSASKRPYDANIVGVRSSNNRAGKFDDSLSLIWRNKQQRWEVYTYPITTDPGAYYLENPMKVKGTAILVPGQYRGAYKLGTHKGYEALAQWGGKVKVWRDRNKDDILDWNASEEDSGFYGINIHRSRANGESSVVGKWSAGCQVFKNSSDFDEFMRLCKRSAKIFGDSFTYTLLEESDFEKD